MRRVLYLCALACLVGVGFCVVGVSDMPNRVGDALAEAEDHNVRLVRILQR